MHYIKKVKQLWW